ncbi:MAG TPA: hypothetical protein VHD63_13260 [Ktedonobacteraceae bacterium]|nr:hypothetical protein [Ktedonobacteraceae bacterium]
MSMHKRRHWPYLVLAACLYGFFCHFTSPVPAHLYAASEPANPVVFSDPVTDTSRVEAYWTPRRMASALSADIPANEKQVAIPRTLHQASKRSLPSSVRSLPVPDPKADPKADPVHPPYSQEGKIFFSDGGRDWVCSGTALVSDNHSLVDTAGHCVADDRHFVSNWIFCPMYDGNGCHYYIAKLLATDKLWLDHSDHPDGWFGYDFGMAVVVPTLKNKKLTDSFGGMLALTNLDPAHQTYLAVGYPAAPPFNGQTQQKCESQVTRNDDQGGDVNALGIQCDMTGGSSGGGWFIVLSGQLYLNGHTSYGYRDDPTILYSPYFGQIWENLFQAAQNISI